MVKPQKLHTVPAEFSSSIFSQASSAESRSSSFIRHKSFRIPSDESYPPNTCRLVETHLLVVVEERLVQSPRRRLLADHHQLVDEGVRSCWKESRSLWVPSRHVVVLLHEIADPDVLVRGDLGRHNLLIRN